jgi:hypothetical protein
MTINKNIFIFWLQGWDNCYWLNKQVVDSWKIQNPGWKIHLISFNNLKFYFKNIDNIDYIYDDKKLISPQAKSDIIRLALLNKYGGVWADATLLCMQPLDNWIYKAIELSGFWMYHGHGAEMSKENGPASWFIVSKKNNYIINKWKNKCDEYWNKNNFAHSYFWMDELFKDLFYDDAIFNELWKKVPYIYCEEDGESHTLNKYKMEKNNPYIKEKLYNNPPYVLKMWNNWRTIFPNVNVNECKKSNGYFAILMSKKIKAQNIKNNLKMKMYL